MRPPNDSEFRAAYAVFERDHGAKRAELLARLATIERAGERTARRRLMRTPMGLAASLLAVFTLLVYMNATSAPRAYGVEGLRERLLAIRSLHVKGWLYQQTETEFGAATLRFPQEEFYERPYRRYHTAYGFSFASGEALSDVTRAVIVGDDEKTMLVDRNDKRAIIAGADVLNAQLLVETQLQVSIAERMLCGLPEEFSVVGREKIGRIMCDVYESPTVEDEVVPFRTRLWLNPENGMPMKWIAYRMDEEQGALPFIEWSEIQINVPAPDGMFDYRAPEGYEVIEVPVTHDRAPVQPLGSGAAFDDWAANWIALNIDDRAALVCWSQRSNVDGKERWFERPVEFSLRSLTGGESRPCDEIALHTHDAGEIRWRWSLVKPRDGKPIGGAIVSGACKGRHGHVSLWIQPLRFGPTKLAKMVVNVQRATLPDGSDERSRSTTLEEIRRIHEGQIKESENSRL